MRLWATSLALGLCLLANATWAQMVEVPDDPPASSGTPSEATSRELNKAEEYMRARKPKAKAKKDGQGEGAEAVEPMGPAARYLDVHVGGFLDSQGYRWGSGDQYKSGKFDIGVDYRLGEWVNAADFMLRVDYTTYSLSEGAARQLSFSGLVSFPDANSRFPLYFGAALGPGFFLKQIPHQSVLALDYSLFVGARLLNVIQRVGFLIEAGLKDHIHVFSQGQFNGVYLNAGVAWMF